LKVYEELLNCFEDAISTPNRDFLRQFSWRIRSETANERNSRIRDRSERDGME
jgi:hypothetical protein